MVFPGADLFPDSGLWPSSPETVIEPTTVVLDPVEVADSRVELPINQGAITIAEGGPDWGDAAIQTYMAEVARGDLPVDFRIPDRQARIPLVLGGETRDDVAYNQARAQLQQKVALLQREGGWVKRGGLYADVVAATLAYPDKLGAMYGVEVDVVLTLELLPDFYGDELELGDHVETVLPELVFVESVVLGDYPGRLRLVVDNDVAADQRGLIAAVRSRHYSAASTARLVYEAEALTPVAPAAVAALSGASGGNAIEHGSLSTSWQPLASTDLVSGGPLTHVGSYRVMARAYTASASVSLRLVWGVGDLLSPTENDAVSVPGVGSFYLVDLGSVALTRLGIGAHRWQGQIQAKGAAGGESIYVDRLYLVPLDEGMAKLQAPLTVSGGVSPSQRDEFNQTTGALTGKALPVGGVWVAGAGSDPTDFAVDAAAHVATRSEVSDVAYAGRRLIAGVGTLTDTFASVNVLAAGDIVDYKQGVVARYSDANNWLMAYLYPFALTLRLAKCVAGVVSVIGFSVAAAPVPWMTVALLVTAGGDFRVWSVPQGAALGAPAFEGHDADLAVGGALASGGVGIYDEQLAPAPSVQRSYDNFTAYAPTSDAVAFASRSVQVTSDRHAREARTGGIYGPVAVERGDLLRIPPSGMEARPVEFLVKLSRGDFDAVPDVASEQLPDAAIDALSARVFYRPSYLFPYGA